jgi:hypothetical protein
MISRFPGRAKGLSLVAEVLILLSGLSGVVGWAAPTIAASGTTGKAISLMLIAGALVGIASRFIDHDDMMVVALRIQSGTYFVWAVNSAVYTFGLAESPSGNPNLQGIFNLLVLCVLNLAIAHALTVGPRQEKKAIEGLRESLQTDEAATQAVERERGED